MNRSNKGLEVALVLTALAYVSFFPFTKVEESFSLHAIRDFLSYPQVTLAQFDHLHFSGAVPRSLLGPVVLSAAVWPLLWLGRTFDLWMHELAVQSLVRSTLAVLSSASLIFLFRRVRDSFGRPVAKYSLILTLSQFHLLFYLGRTLPNMFAFPLAQVVLAMFIAPWVQRTKKGKGSNVELLEGFAVLTFTAIVMRLELLALLAPLALESLSKGTTMLYELVVVGIVAAFVGLGATVGLDSFMWNRLVWPEGEAIYFNVVEGHASDWGISPWHYYFTNSLPKIFNFSLPLIFFGLFIDRRIRCLITPSFLFVVLLSFLKHKEWRFFVYIIPTVNACAAAGIQSLELLFSRRLKFLALGLILATNLSFGFLAFVASTQNYPGGEAMNLLANMLAFSPPPTPVAIHIDSHSAMTGASRFLHPFESPAPWYLTPDSTASPLCHYNRSESLSDLDFHAFDYLLTGDLSRHTTGEKKGESGWDVIATLSEFDGYDVGIPSRGDLISVSIKRKPSVWILKRIAK